MMVTIVALLAAQLVSAASAAANSDFDQRHPTCFLDRIEYCKNVDGLAAIFQCLDKNQDRLSPPCKTSLEKSPAFQCSFDLMLLCPLANDHYDLMSCLWTHRQGQLSTRCVNSGLGQHHDDDGKFHQCRQDKKKFCHGLSGFSRVMSCLADHVDELSSGCRAAMEACPAFKCAHDVERFCPNVSSHHDFAKCIWHHREEVSQECKEALSGPPLTWFSHNHHDHRDKEHHGKHHHGRHHREPNHERHRHGKYHHPGHHKHVETKHHEDLQKHHKKHHGKHHHHHRHHHRHHHDGDHGHGRYFRACKFDIRRFCYDAEGFVDKMACLASHQDELSDSCSMVLKRCPAFHCAHDVQKFCPGVRNKHEFIGCLWEHRRELSDECMNQGEDGGDDSGDNHGHSEDKCRHEREKFCPEDQKESPKHDIECLGNKKNKDDFSHECRKSLNIRIACQDEVEKFCSSDSSYPLKCLKQHEQDLGNLCKAALAKGPEIKLSIDFSSIMSKPSKINKSGIAAFAAILLTAIITTSLVIFTCRKSKAAAEHHFESQYQRI